MGALISFPLSDEGSLLTYESQSLTAEVNGGVVIS